MTKNHGPQIKDDEQYEALRREGMSKEKAARIANTDRREAGRKGGQAAKYEDWKKDDLYGKAQEVGIAGRSKMNKDGTHRRPAAPLTRCPGAAILSSPGREGHFLPDRAPRASAATPPFGHHPYMQFPL